MPDKRTNGVSSLSAEWKKRNRTTPLRLWMLWMALLIPTLLESTSLLPSWVHHGCLPPNPKQTWRRPLWHQQQIDDVQKQFAAFSEESPNQFAELQRRVDDLEARPASLSPAISTASTTTWSLGLQRSWSLPAFPHQSNEKNAPPKPHEDQHLSN